MGCAILWIDRVGIAPSGCCFQSTLWQSCQPQDHFCHL